MEVFGGVANVIALLDVLKKVGVWANDSIKADKERQVLLDSLDRLRSIIQRIDQRCIDAQSGDGWYEGLLELVKTSGTLTPEGKYQPNPQYQSETSLSKLYLILQELIVELSPAQDSRTKQYVRRLRYHWDKVKYEGLLREFARCRDEISFVLDDDHFKLSKAIREEGRETLDQISEIKSRMTTMQDIQQLQEQRYVMQKAEADRDAIEQWLSPLEFLARQEEIVENAFETGQWFLDSLPFQHWVKGKPWHLRVYGVEGSGKTLFSSVIFRHLKQIYGSEKRPVICLYLSYKERSSQTFRFLMGSLLKQCLQLQKSSPVPKDILEWYTDAKATRAPAKEKEITDALKRAINSYDHVFLVVDALDECDFRGKLVAELQALPADKVSLMITSRPIDGEERADVVDCDVCKSEDVKLYYRCSVCKMDICSNCEENGNCGNAQSHTLAEVYDRVEVLLRTPPEEIRAYVEYEISKEVGSYGSQLYDNRRYSTRASRPDATKLGRRCAKDPDLLKQIPDAIVDRADGRFLFAKLYLDSLRSKQTKRHIKETLENFPDELDKIYDEAMQRIKDQKSREDRELGMKTLSRVFSARRPLSFAELQHALAIVPGEEDFDEDLDYFMEDILASCAGLITIDADGNAVRFVHLTLQTYLDSNCAKWIPRAEMEMTEICLTYLNYDVFAEPCDNADFGQRKQTHPFINYASQHWGTHVRDAGPSPDIDAAALQIVSDPHRVAAYVQAAWFTDDRGTSSWDCRRGIDGLHVCALLGLDRIIGKLVQEGSDVDIRETTYGQTPLIYACRSGHVDAVRKLLELSASVNLITGRGRTALLEAIAEGREEIAETLLGRDELDVNVSNANEAKITALMLAADLGFSNIIDMLLEHPRDLHINVNQQNSDGLTALSLAAAKGHDQVVKSLLRHPRMEIDLQDSITGRTALIIAAERDYLSIVKLLLDSGADPMLRDKQGGGNALHRAVDYHCMNVLNLMIERKVNLKCVDDDGRGLIHSASVNGWPDIVRLLVSNGAKPDEQDNDGLTPLHDASRTGNGQVTKTLLELGAERSIQDAFGRTPRTLAWQHGHFDIMNLLDGKSPTDHDALTAIPEPENLPGWSIAKLGLTDLVEQAITSRQQHRLAEVEPISNDNALHHSVLGDHGHILHLLLERGPIPPNNTNKLQRTPLHLAAILGNIPLALDLLAHGANPDLEDIWTNPALLMAVINKHSAIALALIEAGAAIDAQKKNKVQAQPLLFAAIRLGSLKAVRLLLEQGANILDRSPDGLTPRQVAIEADQGEILQLLMETPTNVSVGGAFGEPTEMEERLSVLEPEMEHRFVPFRSRPVVI